MKKLVALAMLAIAAAGTALGDKVYLNNGDRFTGEVKSADGGVLVFSPASGGELKIPMADVASFSTDKPLELHLNDGTVLKQPIIVGSPGQIGTVGDGPVQGKEIPLNMIKAINPPPIKWTGSLAAGVILTRGNTHTDAAHASFDAIRRAEDDRITLSGSYHYAREKTDEEGARVTMENWIVAGKYDHFLSEKWYVYGNAKVERDHIANLDLRITPGAGVGYQWVESAKVNFNTEAGLTWVYERYTDPEVTRNYIAGRLAYHYDHQLNENLKFIHNFEVLPSLENVGEFLLTTDAGLRAKLTDDFFGEAKVVLQHNSQPAEGKDKNDVRYMLSIGWGF